jgi:hypothetical protein
MALARRFADPANPVPVLGRGRRRRPALAVGLAVAGLALALGACTGPSPAPRTGAGGAVDSQEHAQSPSATLPLRGAKSRRAGLEAAAGPGSYGEPGAGTYGEPGAGSYGGREAAGGGGTFERPAGPRPGPPGFEVGGLPDRLAVAGGAPPVRLSVPAIGVETPLVRLGLEPDRTMQVPEDFGRAGWFAGGPAPGQPGPAVIAGHVDSRTGPAVFYRLRELRPDDHIEVTRTDGTRLRFVVEGVRSFPKASFPTDAVFGPTPAAELRLVTCTGTFDRARGSYRDNLVVFARLDQRPGIRD